jgi:hypothetical protein
MEVCDVVFLWPGTWWQLLTGPEREGVATFAGALLGAGLTVAGAAWLSMRRERADRRERESKAAFAAYRSALLLGPLFAQVAQTFKRMPGQLQESGKASPGAIEAGGTDELILTYHDGPRFYETELMEEVASDDTIRASADLPGNASAYVLGTVSFARRWLALVREQCMGHPSLDQDPPPAYRVPNESTLEFKALFDLAAALNAHANAAWTVLDRLIDNNPATLRPTQPGK